MPEFDAVFENGETVRMRQLEGGLWPCPICGDPWPYPPLNPPQADGVSRPAFGDICEGCRIEFGVDEGCAPYAPIGTMRRQFMKFRIEWLDRVGWNPDALKQLKDNLGITEEEAKRQADEVRESKKE